MKNKKFTLIELLVVIAIIGILLSLLAPSLSSARAKARLSVCLNNMKQIGMGITMYTMSNNGTPFETYRTVQDDLEDNGILNINSGAWECPEDKGTWGYAYNSKDPMTEKGETTFEAQDKSYLVTGQFNNLFEYKDEDDPSQGETSESQGNIRNITAIEEPSLYYWSSCAPLRGTFGDVKYGILNLWHEDKPRWPMGFADGHASIIYEPRAMSTFLGNGQVKSPYFIVKQ